MKNQVKLKIHLPAHLRKMHASESNDDIQASKSELDATLKLLHKMHKRKTEFQEDKTSSRVSDEQSNKATSSLKKCGEPAKKESTGPQPTTALKKHSCPSKIAKDLSTQKFSVSVFVEVAQPPVMTRGKTYKGDKLVNQPPIMERPFTMTYVMQWPEFLEEVAELAEIEEENVEVAIALMTWDFHKKNPLPLKGVSGYKMMVQ